MPEWMGLEWWKVAWGPLAAAGLVYFATIWNKDKDARGVRDARMDARQDKELARLAAENDELRDDRNYWEDVARAWMVLAHEIRHEANGIIMVLDRGRPTPAPKLQKLPPFEELVPRTKPRPN